MVAPRQLARPPITEALVDVRIARDERLDIERLQRLRAQLKDDYPKFDEKKQFQAEFRVEAGKLLPPTAQDLGFNGVWLTSADGSRIVQFRPDGFTFNNVGSYMGGDALLREALRLWSEFGEVAHPASVIRIALRYLNRLELPMKADDDFNMFLTTPPDLPPEAPQRFSSFLSRIVAHEAERSVIVTQKLDLGAPPTAPILLDIDAFLVGDFPAHQLELLPHLESLRELKNRVFFSLLTEETVKLYV